MILNLQEMLFLLLSVAMYVMRVFPMGRSAGGTSAGTTLSDTVAPELSTGAGTSHVTRA